jgi:hypothetical protein
MGLVEMGLQPGRKMAISRFLIIFGNAFVICCSAVDVLQVV